MRFFKYISFFGILFLTSFIEVQGQDPQFSQFYSSPLYNAPSFAGTTDGSRVVANYRDQWPNIPGRFITYSASIDHYFHNLKSGAGLLLYRDQAGSAGLNTTLATGQYSYNLRLSRKWIARPGIQATYAQRSIRFNDIVLGDQLSFDGNLPTSQEINSLDDAKYVDFGSSVFFYSSKYWFGGAVDHLMEPNQSIMGGESIVPRKYTFFAGGKYRISPTIGRYKEESIAFSVLYKSQAKFDQFDAGGYWYINPLLVGLRYRGIPFIKRFEAGVPNNDAIIAILGFRAEGFNIGYSYDITVSRLNTTAGAHEISVSYKFNQGAPKKKIKVIFPCPEF